MRLLTSLIMRTNDVLRLFNLPTLIQFMNISGSNHSKPRIIFFIYVYIYLFTAPNAPLLEKGFFIRII